MTSEQTENRALGGYKATLHNPNASEGAKHHAAEVLNAHGDLPPDGKQYLSHSGQEGHGHHGQTHHVPVHEGGWKSGPVANEREGDEHDHRVLGGFKATLNNPNASEEAKDRAAEVLAEHNVKV